MTTPRSQTPLLLATGGALLVGAGGAAVLLSGPAVAGATFTVTNANDSGDGSLRWAVGQANGAPGVDTITFDPTVTGTITLTTGELAITEGVTITGPGASVLAVSGNDASRIFTTSGSGNVSISGLEITHGNAGSSSAIRTSHTGDFTLDAVTVDDNTSTGGWAALYLRNTGKVTISDSAIADNASPTGSSTVSAIYTRWNVTDVLLSGTTVTGNVGGGSTILFYGTTVTMQDVTFDSNDSQANSDTAAIFVWAGTSTSIRNSTFSGNSGADGSNKRVLGLGGNGGATTLIANSTITGNTDMHDAVKFFGTTSAAIDQSTITGNSGAEVVIQPSVTLAIDGSVVSDGTASDITAPSAVTITSDHSVLGGTDANVTVTDLGGTLRDVADLGLGALADNGGPTKTMLPLAGSPLIDAGPSTIPTFPGNEYDQRGAGYARIAGTTSDIGAVEVQPTPEPPAPPAPTPVTPRFTG